MKIFLSITLASFLLASLAQAAPLTGSGANLPLPGSTGPTPPGVAPVLANLSGPFTGTWSSPAAGPWLGTFTGTGSYPSSGNFDTSLFNFNGLAAGHLPSGTYVRLSDVDSHNGEALQLAAWDPTGNPIFSEWLDEPVFLSGATPAEFQQVNLPAWHFAAGVYTFTGVNINTLLTISLQTNTAIGLVQVDKAHINNGVGFAAPSGDVPEPGSLVLLGLGLVGMASCRRVRGGMQQRQ